MIAARHASVIALAITSFLSSPTVSADSLSKDQCVDAHSRGQDAKEQGKISLARKLFLSCAQPACPALVQGDCARYADDLTRQQSSLTFVARDAQGNDLPDTTVYVDDSLLLTRLDDGKPHDVDPGKHTVRFTTAGKEQTVTLVVGTGEKGRAVVAAFNTINVLPPGAARSGPGGQPREPEIKVLHPMGSRIMIDVGGGVAATGAVIAVIGFLRVPSNCSVSSGHCTAPPGDPVFDRAKSGVVLADVGLVAGTLGAATLAGGLIWYYTKATTEREPGAVVMPMVTGDAAGIALSGSF